MGPKKWPKQGAFMLSGQRNTKFVGGPWDSPGQNIGVSSLSLL